MAYQYTVHIMFTVDNDAEANEVAERYREVLWHEDPHAVVYLTDGDDWAEMVTEQCLCGALTADGRRFGNGRRYCASCTDSHGPYERPEAEV